MEENELFEQRVAILRDWGLAYISSGPIFTTVTIPFNSYDWSGTCMRGGKFYFGLRAPKAHAILMEAFHNDSVIETKELKKLVHLLIDIGFDNKDYEEEDERWASFEDDTRLLKRMVKKRLTQKLLFLSPLEKLRHIWHVVDGFSWG